MRKQIKYCNAIWRNKNITFCPYPHINKYQTEKNVIDIADIFYAQWAKTSHITPPYTLILAVHLAFGLFGPNRTPSSKGDFFKGTILPSEFTPIELAINWTW